MHTKIKLNLSLLALAAGIQFAAPVAAESRFVSNQDGAARQAHSQRYYRGTSEARRNAERNARTQQPRWQPRSAGQAAALDQRGRAAQQARVASRATPPRVGFNEAPRRAGSGYNNTRYDRRVAQPRSILRGGDQYQATQRANNFGRRLNSQTQTNLRHRGDVARHARQRHQVTRTLQRSAPTSRALSSTRAVAAHRSAKQSAKALSRAKKLRYVAKASAAGLATAGAVYGVRELTGVEIPDSFDTGAKMLTDPRNAHRHLNQYGKDSINATGALVGKALGSKRIGKQVSRELHSSAKRVSKGACDVGKLFGAKC